MSHSPQALRIDIATNLSHPNLESVFPIIVNERWRVSHDGELQWILAQRTGVKVAPRPSGSLREPWRARYYLVWRRHIISCIKEHCGEVDADALLAVEALPERHPRPDTQ